MVDFSSKASKLLWDTHLQLLKLTVLKEKEQNLCAILIKAIKPKATNIAW